MFNPLRYVLILFVLATMTACGGSSDASYDNGDDPVLVEIEVSPVEAEIGVGATQAYTATGVYSSGESRDITEQVIWTSSDPSVASVDIAGVATGVTQGNVLITADIDTINGAIQDSAELDVVAPAQPVSLEIYPPQSFYSLGTTEDYRAMLVYSDGSVENVTFDAGQVQENIGMSL